MTPTRNVLWHLCQIFQRELGLKDGQVIIYNQKRTIPPTTGLWITVSNMTSKVIGNKAIFENGIEHQSLNLVSTISIDICSRDESAYDRKEEVVMAVKSSFAQSMQEQYAFKIGRIPSTPLVNLSEVEGAAIPYRFNVSFQVHYKTEKQKPVEYYNTFDHSIIVEA